MASLRLAWPPLKRLGHKDGRVDLGGMGVSVMAYIV